MRSEETRQDDLIATRIFERDDGEVIFSLHRPQPHTFRDGTAPDAEAMGCRYSIRFPDGEVFEHCPVGIDAMQALLLALSSARVDLQYKNRGERRTAIRWLGEDDLGLSMPQYD